MNTVGSQYRHCFLRCQGFVKISVSVDAKHFFWTKEAPSAYLYGYTPFFIKKKQTNKNDTFVRKKIASSDLKLGVQTQLESANKMG